MAVDVTPAKMAVTLAEPVARAVTRPRELPAFDTLATAGADDNHVATAVMSRVLESLYVPVAVSC